MSNESASSFDIGGGTTRMDGLNQTQVPRAPHPSTAPLAAADGSPGRKGVRLSITPASTYLPSTTPSGTASRPSHLELKKSLRRASTQGSAQHDVVATLEDEIFQDRSAHFRSNQGSSRISIAKVTPESSIPPPVDSSAALHSLSSSVSSRFTSSPEPYTFRQRPFLHIYMYLKAHLHHGSTLNNIQHFDDPKFVATLRRFLWTTRARRIRLMLHVLYPVVCVIFILAVLRYFRDDEYLDYRTRQLTGTASMFVGLTPFFFVVTRYELPASAVWQGRFSMGFLAMYNAFYIYFEVERRPLYFIFLVITHNLTCPTRPLFRSLNLFAWYAITGSIWLRRINTGFYESECLAVMRDELGPDPGNPACEVVDAHWFVANNTTFTCVSPWIMLTLIFGVGLIVTVSGIIIDASDFMTFSLIYNMHDEKVNMEIENARRLELNEEQVALIDALQADIEKEHKENNAQDAGSKETQDERLNVRYEDIEFKNKLGQGSFGTVWAAVFYNKGDRKVEGTLVAVKTLNSDQLLPDNIKRFGFEIKTMLGLKHAGIVEMVGAVVTPPTLCLMLKLAGRGSFTKVLMEGSALGSESDENLGKSWHNPSGPPGCNIRAMVLSVAKALAFCHERKIVHRDVKTDNCLVNDDWSCVLSDFGEAKVIDDTMTSVGTPYYIAPEVYRGEGTYGEKSDCYSYGITLGAALYGGFVDDLFWWDRSKKLSGYIVSQRVLRGWRPPFKMCFELGLPTIINLIKRCWKTEPSERPSMQEIVEELEHWAGDAPSASTARGTAQHDRRLTHQGSPSNQVARNLHHPHLEENQNESSRGHDSSSHSGLRDSRAEHNEALSSFVETRKSRMSGETISAGAAHAPTSVKNEGLNVSAPKLSPLEMQIAARRKQAEEEEEQAKAGGHT